MQRLRRKSAGSYTLSVETRDEDGAVLTCDGPPAQCSVDIVDGAGGPVISGAPATIGQGQLSVEVDHEALPYLDAYTCTWHGRVAGLPYDWTSVVELAGSYLFEVSDLRSFDQALADSTRYPAPVIRAARTAAEIRLERAAHVAFVPRGARYTTTGDGTSRLRLPHCALRALRSASIAGIELSASELAAVAVREWGALDRVDGALWPANKSIVLWYEHGYDWPPAPVRQAAMVLAREYLVSSALSSRATVEATDVGFFRLSVAGPERPTGLPEVDEVIREFGRPAAGIA